MIRMHIPVLEKTLGCVSEQKEGSEAEFHPSVCAQCHHGSVCRTGMIFTTLTVLTLPGAVLIDWLLTRRLLYTFQMSQWMQRGICRRANWDRRNPTLYMSRSRLVLPPNLGTPKCELGALQVTILETRHLDSSQQ